MRQCEVLVAPSLIEEALGLVVMEAKMAGLPSIVFPSGGLPDGAKFSGPDGFREALVARQNIFVSTMTAKLLTYALGRGVEYSDMPAVRTNLDAVRKKREKGAI